MGANWETEVRWRAQRPSATPDSEHRALITGGLRARRSLGQPRRPWRTFSAVRHAIER